MPHDLVTLTFDLLALRMFHVQFHLQAGMAIRLPFPLSETVTAHMQYHVTCA